MRTGDQSLVYGVNASVSIELAEAPILAKGKVKVRPEHISIMYRVSFGNSGGMVAQGTAWTVSGHSLKADGSRGAEHEVKKYHMDDLRTPEWITQLVKDNHPDWSALKLPGKPS